MISYELIHQINLDCRNGQSDCLCVSRIFFCTQTIIEKRHEFREFVRTLKSSPRNVTCNIDVHCESSLPVQAEIVFKGGNKHSLFACRLAHNPFALLRTAYESGRSRLSYLNEKSATQRATVTAATPVVNRFRLCLPRIYAALRTSLSCRKLLPIRFALRFPGNSVN